VFAVTKSGKKKFWQPIGALFTYQDGKGFNLSLDYLPLKEADLVIREIAKSRRSTTKGALNERPYQGRARWLRR